MKPDGSDYYLKYPDIFDKVHCDEETKKHEFCAIVPAWRDKKTGKRLCYVHAAMRWRQLEDEAEKKGA